MAKPVLLSKEAILAASELKAEDVEVPEWGGTVRVRELTGTELDAYQASMRQQRGKNFVLNEANVRSKLAVRAIVGDDGERLFADSDAAALGKLSSAALDRVFEVAARLSRISDEDVEEMAKNSGAGQSEGSISG